MVRTFIGLAACIMFGISVTVALAWAFALTSRFDTPHTDWVYRSCAAGEGTGLFDIMIHRARGGTHYRSFQGILWCGTGYAAVQGDPDKIVPSWARAALGPWNEEHMFELSRVRFGEPQPWSHNFGEVQAWGWPCRALWFEGRGQETKGGIPAPEWLPVRRERTTWPHSEPTLPLRPAWTGLAANTGLFSSAAIILLLGPGLARRWSRRRDGCCRACGYDVRSLIASGIEKCPECGTAATHSMPMPRHATRTPARIP